MAVPVQDEDGRVVGKGVAGRVEEQPKREVRRKLEDCDGAGAGQMGSRVPGVDEGEHTGAKVEPAEQPGREALVGLGAGMRDEGVVGSLGLLK